MKKVKKVVESGGSLTLAQAVADLDFVGLKGSLVKTEYIQFRASKLEKNSVNALAGELGLSTSEYLLKLHFLVEEKLRAAPPAV